MRSDAWFPYFDDRARAERWARRLSPFTFWGAVMLIVARWIWPAYLPRWGIVTMPMWGAPLLLIGGPIVLRIAWRLVLRPVLRAAFARSD